MSEQRKAHQNNCLNTENYALYFENVFGCVSSLSSKNQYRWSAQKMINTLNYLGNTELNHTEPVSGSAGITN